MNKAYEVITNRIIELIEKKKTLPWELPWVRASGKNKNGITGHKYTGINNVMTTITQLIEGYDSSLWFTFKQVQSKRGFVKKGQKGTPILFYITLEKEKEKNGEIILQKIPCARYYTVFNQDQCENLDIEAKETKTILTVSDNEQIQCCEDLLAQFILKPSITKGSRASYVPSTDTICMPDKTSFKNINGYYSTLFHELSHSTGHESRLKRFKSNEVRLFGDQSYSKEELIAELSSSFLCAHCYIEKNTIEQSASYLESWLKILKGSPKLLIESASAAQKSADFIINTEGSAS